MRTVARLLVKAKVVVREMENPRHDENGEDENYDYCDQRAVRFVFGQMTLL